MFDAINRQAVSLKEQRDDLSGIISLPARRVWLDIQDTQKRIEVTQQTIAQADENIKVTNDRYQHSLSTKTGILKAEDLRTKAHDNFNNASHDAVLAALHLRRVAGVL